MLPLFLSMSLIGTPIDVTLAKSIIMRLAPWDCGRNTYRKNHITLDSQPNELDFIKKLTHICLES
jgi:hypothetical protein